MPNKDCQCQSEQFYNLPEPLFRLVCHCLTCQEFVDGPYNDECTFLLSDCPDLKLKTVEFKSYQALSPIKRGICVYCGKASICQAKMGPLAHFVMIPSHRLDPVNLPEPIAHVYYHRRKADAHDSSPKINGHWRSQLKILVVIMSRFFSRKPR